MIAFGVRQDQTKPAGQDHRPGAHRNRDHHIRPQFQLADIDRLAENGSPEPCCCRYCGERRRAILDPADIGIWDKPQGVRAPVIPVPRHCNLTFHPDLRQQPRTVERPGSYPQIWVNEPDVIIGLPVQQAAFKIQRLRPVARDKIRADKPAGAIDRTGLLAQITIRKVKLQHRPRKEGFGIFPVNAERGQHRFCIAGFAVDPGTRDLTPGAIMNEPAIQ